MAQTLGHDDWTPAEWMADPKCYRAAVHEVLKTMVLAQPAAWTEGFVKAPWRLISIT